MRLRKKECRGCHESFMAKKPNIAFCNSACREKYRYSQYKAMFGSKWRTEACTLGAWTIFPNIRLTTFVFNNGKTVDTIGLN